MAQFQRVESTDADSVLCGYWALTNADQVAVPIDIPAGADYTVHFVGDFGGATFVLQGTGNPDREAAAPFATFLGLNDSRGKGNLITCVADAAFQVLELMARIKPLGSSFGAGTNIRVYINAGKRRR